MPPDAIISLKSCGLVAIDMASSSRDAAGLQMAEQRLVEGLHPVVGALGDRLAGSCPVMSGSMIMSLIRAVVFRTSQTATRP